MRYTFIIVALWVLSTLAACGEEGKPDYALFPTKSGMINYRWAGDIKGQETIYWDDWGRSQARTKNVTSTRQPITNNTVILTPEASYMIDYNENRATKLAGGTDGLAEQRRKNEAAMTPAIRERALGEKIGTLKIADTSCDAYRNQHSPQQTMETCVTHDMLLRMASTQLNFSFEMLAVKVELGIPVDAARFLPPPGMPLNDLSTLQAKSPR